jgi:hypothetical protein
MSQPAFPQIRTLPDGSHEECEGLTIRDYFAINILQGLLSSPNSDPSVPMERYAKKSYVIADVMVKARQA